MISKKASAIYLECMFHLIERIKVTNATVHNKLLDKAKTKEVSSIK